MPRALTMTEVTHALVFPVPAVTDSIASMSTNVPEEVTAALLMHDAATISSVATTVAATSDSAVQALSAPMSTNVSLTHVTQMPNVAITRAVLHAAALADTSATDSTVLMSMNVTKTRATLMAIVETPTAPSTAPAKLDSKEMGSNVSMSTSATETTHATATLAV